ncbi:MAG: ATP-binding protein [Clostridia bacterium]
MAKNKGKAKIKIKKDNDKVKTYVDMISPSVMKFNVDHFICGNTFRCVYAIREYPTTTTDYAILKHLGEKDGVTLHIYTREVNPMESDQLLKNAENKNKLNITNNNLKDNITAQNNLEDMASVITEISKNKEPLLHCAVYIELIADSIDNLKQLQTEVLTELVRSKINIDRLNLKQQDGFLSVMPSGKNHFGTQFERVLPASSVANLFPFNYSGKTDANGFYLGRDKFGSNIIVDFDKREDDKTNANILILGNSGQGKSYLLKLIVCNVLESGKNVITLDPESEMEEMCENLGGTFMDLMAGQYVINPLEVKIWSSEQEDISDDEPNTFREKTKLSQHISFLKDFFVTYKDFTDSQIDVIEIMLSKMYENFGISDNSNFRRFKSTDYPTLSDFYKVIETEYKNYDENKYQLYTKEMLQEILLGLHSMCVGSESNFFNGHTNIQSDRFLVFGVKGLLQASKNVKNAMLFNVLSYMSDKLLTEGNTVATVDELYLFLTNMVAIEYLRNFMKRVRKKESAVILASQNLEDFAIKEIAEFTKPLFSIPTHQFLFHAGTIDKKFYIDTLQLEDSEFNLIKFPQRGTCLFKCGTERYNLMVQAPDFKEKLFGKAGGR